MRMDDKFAGVGDPEEKSTELADKIKIAMGKLDRVNDEIESMLKDASISDEVRKKLNGILEERERDDVGLYSGLHKEDTPELLEVIRDRFKLEKEQFMALKKQQKEKEQARAVTMDRKKAMESKYAEEMGKYFGKDETSVSKHFDTNNKEVVDVDKEKILEERKAEAEKLRIELIESLGKKMEAAEQKWQKKKRENESFAAKLKGLFIGGVTFGEAEKEEELFRLEYEEIKARHDQIAVDVKAVVTEKGAEALPEAVGVTPVLPNKPSDNIESFAKPKRSEEERFDEEVVRRNKIQGNNLDKEEEKFDAEVARREAQRKQVASTLDNEVDNEESKFDAEVARRAKLQEDKVDKEENRFDAEVARRESMGKKDFSTQNSEVDHEERKFEEEVTRRSRLPKEASDREEEKFDAEVARREPQVVFNADHTEGLAENEIRELSERLDVARRAYIIAKNRVDRNSSLVKKITGFGSGSQLEEDNAQFEVARTNYENTLKAYKDAIVRSEVTDAEDARIVAQFLNRGEHLNMSEMRDQIRVEEAHWPGRWKAGYLRMLNGYRELPTSRKLMIGGALIGVGALSGAWAGAAGAGAVMFVRRAFSMSVGSLGYSRMFEGRDENRRAGQSETEAQNISTESVNENGEINKDRLNKLLNEKVDGINQEIQNRDLAKKWRTYGAIGMGVATSFFGSWAGEKVSHLVADSDVVKTTVDFWKPRISHLFEAAIPHYSPMGATIPSHVPSGAVGIHRGFEAFRDPAETAKGVAKGVMSGATEVKAAVEAHLNYQGGHSIWQESQRQISARLHEHFDNLGAGNGNAAEALKTYNVDRLKDIIATHPGDYGLPEGANLDKLTAEQLKNVDWDKAFHETFDAEGITEKLADSQVDSIVENNEALREAAQAHVTEAATASVVEQGASGNASAYEGFMQQVENYFSPEEMKDSNAFYNNYPEFRGVTNFDAEVAKLGDEIAKGGDQVALTEKMQALSELKGLREHFSDNYTKIVKSFLDFKAGDSLAALNTTSAREFVQGPSDGKTLQIFKALRSTMSADQIRQFKIDPTKEDTILTWSQRVATFILKKSSEK